MNMPRSTFYTEPCGQRPQDARIVEKIGEICVEFPRYGYRRVTAQLRRDGFVVNHKKTMRIMREQGLSVRPKRRYVRTTDSDHGGPIFSNLTRGFALTGPNQLWVADLTYISIARGFAYLAVILDAWSRRVVGYAIARFLDTRLTIAALQAAIDSRHPQPGCIHHSDRGSQYAAEDYRMLLAKHGLRGSMGRRGNPYDNARAESFMKTLKVEAVYLADYETFTEVITDLPHFIDEVYNKRRLHSAIGYVSPNDYEEQRASATGKP
ncbi:MAG: IS3 family transposase [Rhizobiaceae bacterium]|nr:IS3 family transposase [Rhizobiaceae bacterium]